MKDLLPYRGHLSNFAKPKDHLTWRLRNKARLLQDSTYAERVFYDCLRRRHPDVNVTPQKMLRMNGRPIYLDFHFRKWKVAVEIDGGYHATQRAKDRARDAFLLERRQVLTVRYTNREVLEHTDQVVDRLVAFMKQLPILAHTKRKHLPDALKLRQELHSTFIGNPTKTTKQPTKS